MRRRADTILLTLSIFGLMGVLDATDADASRRSKSSIAAKWHVFTADTAEAEEVIRAYDGDLHRRGDARLEAQGLHTDRAEDAREVQGSRQTQDPLHAR